MLKERFAVIFKISEIVLPILLAASVASGFGQVLTCTLILIGHKRACAHILL